MASAVYDMPKSPYLNGGSRLRKDRSSSLNTQPTPAPNSDQQALAMVHTLAEDFANEVAALCATNVNDRQWQQFLDQHVPRTDDACKPLDGRSRTLADAKRDHLTQLYRSDPRVAPWAGTAHGVARRASRWWR